MFPIPLMKLMFSFDKSPDNTIHGTWTWHFSPINSVHSILPLCILILLHRRNNLLNIAIKKILKRRKLFKSFSYLVCVYVCFSRFKCVHFCDPMHCSPPGSSVHGILQAKDTGVGCYSLLQGIVPTQGSNRGLLHCGQFLYHLSHQGSPISGLPSLRSPHPT